MKKVKSKNTVVATLPTVSQDTLAALRHRVLLYGSCVGLLAMLVAMPLQYIHAADPVLLVQDMIVLGCFAIVTYFTFQKKYYSWLSRLVAIVVLGSFTLNIITGTSNGMGIFWIFLYPMSVFILFTAAEALVWSLIFVSIIGSFTLASVQGSFLTNYGVQELWTSTAVLVVLTIINFLRQRYSEKGRDALLQAEAQLLHQQIELRKFKLAADNAYDHIVITDPEGVILYANAATTRITGYDHDEIIGTKAGKLWSLPMPRAFYKRLWTTIKVQKKPFLGEIQNRRKNGEVYDASVSISPVLDAKKNILFFRGMERDISQQKQFEQKLAKERAEYERLYRRFDLATDAAHIGVGEWNIRTGAFEMDKEMLSLNGRSLQNFDGTIASWEKSIHPDDLARVRSELTAGRMGKKPFQSVYRVVLPNGDIRYLRAYAMVERGVNGQPERMVGVNWDITQEYLIDKAKSEFISLASHQLRTPLSAINWYIEALLKGDAGKPTVRQRKFLQEVYAGSQRVVKLVESLLNVSRIELGNFIIEPVLSRVQDIAQNALQDLQPAIHEKGLRVSQSIGKNIPALPLDPNLAFIIIQNLLSNAVRYTSKNGKITLRIQRDAKVLSIEVQDTGYGIAKNDQAHIFQKLFRAKNARSKVPDGTGLGLYIVKSIVEACSGNIAFRSLLGRGTTFTVRLPANGMQAKSGTKALTPPIH